MVRNNAGSVVITNSVTGDMVADSAEVAYATTKAALVGFTKALAREMAPHDIRINCICPGYVQTPLVEGMASQSNPDDPTRAISAIAHAVPLGRLGTPDECGELCAFLASNEASYITGTQMVIDGGSTLPETTSMGQIMSETQTTELMQDSALFDDVAKQALGRYEFDGNEAKLLAFSENYTYLVRNPITRPKDAALRISRPGYHTLEKLEGEMAWLRQINDYTPLVVANPLPARDGSYIQSVIGPDGATYLDAQHTRYLHEGIVNYAEHLVALLPPEVDRVMFECSGSEANDLAVRVARAATGGTGIIVTSEAYRGNTALITGLSPSIGTDQPMLPDMRVIPTPDTWRLGTNDIGAWMAARVAEQIADMRRHGFKFAALLVDSRASISSKTPWKRAFCSKTPSSMRQNVTLVWEMCVGWASSSASTS